jgi:hypothetical protein
VKPVAIQIVRSSANGRLISGTPRYNYTPIRGYGETLLC